MFRAVCDVSTASWRVVDEIYRRLNGREEAEIQEHLRERLVSVFGQQSVKYEHKIVGASSKEWDVSAIVQTDHQIARTEEGLVGKECASKCIFRWSPAHSQQNTNTYIH